MLVSRLFTALLLSSLFVTTASAQVFNSGPSDPTLFTEVFNLPGDVLPDPIGGDGQTRQLNVTDGAFYQSLSVLEGTEVNVSGGLLFPFTALGSEVNISNGLVGVLFEARNSVVNVSGGSVGFGFSAFDSVVNISGGTVDASFEANEGSVVNISGGFVRDGFEALEGSEVNISGGTIARNFAALDGSNVSLFGSNFILDGMPLELALDKTCTITERDVTLSGIFSDGSEFSFDLNSVSDPSRDQDMFEPGATLTLTSEAQPGDVNRDGSINFLDIGAFVFLLTTNEFQAEADIDADGLVGFLDIPPFVNLLSPTPPPAEAIVRVRLQNINGYFFEGFEVGLRFETADGTVIGSTFWTDFVREQNEDFTITDLYDSVLEQPVPVGDIVVFAEANSGFAFGPISPDLEGLRCRLEVPVPKDGVIDIEVLFDTADCLRLR